MNCCNAWKKAQQHGTDNEGYGPLIAHGYESERNNWYMGEELPPAIYCPWCGKKVEDPKE